MPEPRPNVSPPATLRDASVEELKDAADEMEAVPLAHRKVWASGSVTDCGCSWCEDHRLAAAALLLVAEGRESGAFRYAEAAVDVPLYKLFLRTLAGTS